MLDAAPGLGGKRVPRKEQLPHLIEVPADTRTVEYPNEIETVLRPFLRQAGHLASKAMQNVRDQLMRPANKHGACAAFDCIEQGAYRALTDFMVHRDSQR